MQLLLQLIQVSLIFSIRPISKNFLICIFFYNYRNFLYPGKFCSLHLLSPAMIFVILSFSEQAAAVISPNCLMESESSKEHLHQNSFRLIPVRLNLIDLHRLQPACFFFSSFFASADLSGVTDFMLLLSGIRLSRPFPRPFFLIDISFPPTSHLLVTLYSSLHQQVSGMRLLL